MREIKFRGLGVDGHWWYGELNPQGQNHVNLATFFTNVHVGGIRPETVAQYIDKSGIEVYEGDIIRHFTHIRHKRTAEVRDLETVRAVSWGRYEDDEYGWTTMCWLLDSTPLLADEPVFQNPYWECLEEKWEVIGNIYENPELLKTK